MTTWFRTDEQEEAVVTLEAAARFLSEADADDNAWRFAIIALHIAAQGFLVNALCDSARLFPLRDNVREEWLEAHRSRIPGAEGGQSEKPYPVEKLDSFPNLYRKLKRPRYAQFLSATPFKPGKSHDKSMRRLNEFRNQFVHFTPTSWSLELDWLPNICRDVLEVAEFAAFRYRWILWHDESHRGRAQAALTAARVALDSLSAKFAKLRAESGDAEAE